MNTEIEIPVSQLKSVLPGLSKIISRSTTLPVLQCVKVSLDPEEKTVSLQAHNLDEIATVKLPNQANGLSGELLIPLEMLSKIVKGCAADQSVRLVGTKDETKIRYSVAGSFVDRLVTHIPVKEWPEVKVIDQDPITLDEAFKEALKQAMECASEDSSRYVLNGAALDVRDKDQHYVVGTDGRHLFAANTFHFGLPETLIIPGRKFISWTGFVNDGAWTLRMKPAVKVEPKEKKEIKDNDEPPWLRIDSDLWTYIARAIDGQFPNWKQVVPEHTGQWTSIVLQPSAMETILNAIPLLPGGDESYSSITLAAGNGVVLRAKGRDQAEWTSINVPDVQVTGKAVQTALNRNVLAKALRFGLQRIQIQDSLAPLIFSNAGKTMIVMPIRMEEPVKTVPDKETNSAQPETESTAPPSAADAPTTTEERKTMPATTMTTPERGNIQAINANGQDRAEEPRSAFKAALDHIDCIKTNLRDVLSDLGEAVSLLKTAEKEQKSNAKEIDAVRAKLREIQSVKI